MIPAVFVLVYFAAVLYLGIFAFRRAAGHEDAEDFFLAGRRLGPAVFLLSLFGTHMTAFAILGSSGHAFHNGIVTYGLMASSSALVAPLLLLFVGTRLWAAGKRHGLITPVQIFRDRWECGHIGTVIFAVQAALLVPYIIIGVKGGGTALAAITGGLVPFWLGGLVVALVVMSYVFFGGMRGTAWVNTLQTALFLGFGAIAVAVISAGMGGFSQAMEKLAASADTSFLLSRERFSPAVFFSYTFTPLSAIAFPHVAIFCLTARRMSQFRRTVILYPLCLLAVWLPCVFLGVAANSLTEEPRIAAKIEARQALAPPAPLAPADRAAVLARMNADDVLLVLLERYAPLWLAGILGAGILAAVMATDSQILALSTMFTEDIFAYYGAKAKFGEQVQVHTGRLFVVVITAVAYWLAIAVPVNIFELATQYAFAGFSALSPLPVAAMYWRRSTKWGALAASLWVVVAVTGVAVFQAVVSTPKVVLAFGGAAVLARTASGTTVCGLLPVVPMTLISVLLLVTVSLMTAKPGRATLGRYFE